jgi:TPP-dependent pyruvate/acetoin dehydrogenase alpha subunit
MPLQVREVALEAIERARRGDGPTLIEAETYRFRGHSLADPDELRSKEEKAAYAVRGWIAAAAAAAAGLRGLLATWEHLVQHTGRGVPAEHWTCMSWN